MAKSRDEKASHQVRVNADLGEMIAWIARVEEVSTSQLLDPMLRPQILARYERVRPSVEKMKAAEAALRKAEDEARAALRESDEKVTKKKRS